MASLTSRDVDAVARHRLAVDDHVELGHARDLLDLDVPRALDPLQRRGGAVGELLEHLEVGAEDLDRQVALHARDELVHPQRDGLREREAQARDLGEVLLDGLDQLGLVPPACPTACAA